MITSGRQVTVHGFAAATNRAAEGPFTPGRGCLHVRGSPEEDPRDVPRGGSCTRAAER